MWCCIEVDMTVWVPICEVVETVLPILCYLCIHTTYNMKLILNSLLQEGRQCNKSVSTLAVVKIDWKMNPPQIALKILSVQLQPCHERKFDQPRTLPGGVRQN